VWAKVEIPLCSEGAFSSGRNNPWQFGRIVHDRSPLSDKIPNRLHQARLGTRRVETVVVSLVPQLATRLQASDPAWCYTGASNRYPKVFTPMLCLLMIALAALLSPLLSAQTQPTHTATLARFEISKGGRCGFGVLSAPFVNVPYTGAVMETIAFEQSCGSGGFAKGTLVLGRAGRPIPAVAPGRLVGNNFTSDPSPLDATFTVQINYPDARGASINL
jgi:hypothetical protein